MIITTTLAHRSSYLIPFPVSIAHIPSLRNNKSILHHLRQPQPFFLLTAIILMERQNMHPRLQWFTPTATKPIIPSRHATSNTVSHLDIEATLLKIHQITKLSTPTTRTLVSPRKITSI
ncbi:unnamed protein product [Vicia faba]|uniref:Uncharacterized protein n=1 Tax=Vicia faba TaxID=3906 RepID=A0AAV0ZSC8_VICFA|nr:unnamed protein product [Vicia faba]